MAHEIRLRPFIDEIARRDGRSEEELEQEFLDIALKAARQHLGDATPLRAELGKKTGGVTVRQVLTMSDSPDDPASQISVEVGKALMPDNVAGDTVAIPIIHGFERPKKLEALIEPVKERLPHPLYCASLARPLQQALNEAVLQYFPAPTFDPGTLGALLGTGGGWLRGLSVTAGGLEVTIERTTLEYIRLHPERGWIDVEIDVRAGDELWQLKIGDNSSTAEKYLALPTDESSNSACIELMQQWTATIAQHGTDAMSEYAAAKDLLAMAIKQPEEGSLWSWVSEDLHELLAGRSFELEHGSGVTLGVRVAGLGPPSNSPVGFGHTYLGLELEHRPTGVRVDDGIYVGALGPDALRTRLDAAEERQDCLAIAETFADSLEVYLQHHLEERGPDLSDNYLYGFEGHFPIVELLEQRLVHGPPPPPPLPDLTEEAVERAAGEITAASDEARERVHALLEDAGLVAVYEIRGYVIVLTDRLSERPFANCAIQLLAPREQVLSEVLRADQWNPASKAVVDGDAFAFARFTRWLREAIRRGGHDGTVVFRPEDDQPIRMQVSDWLLFGQPDVGDRFIVDWRHQWNVVFAGASITDCFSSIYGMSTEQIQKLDEHDRAVWRAFLHDVVG